MLTVPMFQVALGATRADHLMETFPSRCWGGGHNQRGHASAGALLLAASSEQHAADLAGAGGALHKAMLLP